MYNCVMSCTTFQLSLLCCLSSSSGEERRQTEETEAGQTLDRVEQAFRRFDIDHDGLLSWSEFKQVNGPSMYLQHTYLTFHLTFNNM